MAGAGGTGKPKQPSIDDLREALIPELLKHLSGPAPTPPQYQPTPISPMQGYAMARNPQAAGLINQTIQAPGQAQFQQQQAAFEQAMGGRQDAMQVGAGMINAQGRATASSLGGRPALGTIEIDGKRTLVNVIRDPDGTARIQELGPQPWSPGNIPAVPGVNPQMTFPRPGSRPGAATDIPNAPTPPAPAPVEEDYRKNKAFIDGAEHLRQSFRELKASTVGRGPIGAAIGQELGESKYGGAIPYSAANAKFEADLKTTLDTMIVGVTGLSFPEAAFKRYRTELPIATDSEDQAMQKIDNVVRKFINEQKQIKGTYPAAGGSQAPYSGITLHESDFANAKSGERERFIAGGGKVVP